jgi:hypothetical protein
MVSGPVIIYGHQGCGKTRHAEALRQHYGKARVFDDYRAGYPLPDDALALTSDPTIEGAIEFGVALAEAASAQRRS